MNPVNKKIGKNLFFSKPEHQFHALVSRPSMHDPASKKLSAPEPSNPCRKKSPNISLAQPSAEPKSSSMYERIAGACMSSGILETVLQIGRRMR